jgi:phosphoserine aminotransferase
MLTLRWLNNNGGVNVAEKRNIEKSDLFYQTLDSIPAFRGTVAREDRRRMNAVFVAENAEVEKEFLGLCEKEGMIGIKGHRTTGGFRVSMYNALPYESVKALTDLMLYFANHKY